MTPLAMVLTVESQAISNGILWISGHIHVKAEVLSCKET